MDQFSDLLNEASLVDQIGDLTDNNLFSPRAFDRFCKGPPPHLDNSFAFTIGLNDRLSAVDEAGGGEVRTWDMFHQLFDGDVRVFHHRNQTVHDFSQVVWGDIRGHSDSNTSGSVD